MAHILNCVNVFVLCSFVLIQIAVISTGVIIIPDLPEIEVRAGDTFNITCQGKSPPQWQINVYEPNTGDEKSTAIIVDSEENGLYLSNLEIRNTYFLDTGYIYCFPEGSNIDSPETAKIYLYVNDESNLLVVNDSLVILTHTQYSTVIIPCRPTSPNVTVILQKDGNVVDDMIFDPHVGFIIKNATFLHTGTYTCDAKLGFLNSDLYLVVLQIEVPSHTDNVAKPFISQNPSHLVVGKNVTLDCSCRISTGGFTSIRWSVPSMDSIKNGHIKIMNDTLEREKSTTVNSQIGHKKLVIYNVTKQDAGTYVCHVIDASNNTNQDTLELKVFSPNVTYLNLSLKGDKPVIVAEPGVESIQWVVNIEAYPRLQEIVWLDPKHQVIGTSNKKYEIVNTDDSSKLKVNGPDIDNSGIYRLVVNNDAYKKDLNVTLLVKSNPELRIIGTELGFYMANITHTVDCEVVAYPTPKVEWYFKACIDFPKCEQIYKAISRDTYHELLLDLVYLKSSITIKTQTSGELMCVACNQLDKMSNTMCKNETAPYLIIEVENGFAASVSDLVVETDNTTLQCGATKYNYSSSIDWFYKNPITNKKSIIKNSDSMRLILLETNYTYYTNLNIPNIKKNHSGEYICVVHDKYRPKFTEERRVNINVKSLEAPKLLQGSNMGKEMKINIGKSVYWNCFAHGMPPPVITWFKGDQLVKQNNSRLRFKNGGQTLFIEFASLDDDAIYTCVIKNKAGEVKASGEIILLDKPKGNTLYWIILVSLILLICLVAIAWLLRSNMKQRKFKNELSKAGLLHFEKGCIESLNPDLDLQDQADLLPYNKKWEFPREHLKLGKQLGSGAFGVVMKAEALGLLEPDVNTTVAVKMVKRNCDLSYIKALASELKIMSHLGKHLNVVNLLGACTGNLNNKELLVLVEYCRYGNLHNYLLKHRDAFINQVNTRTGEFEPTVIHSPTVTSPRLKYADLSFSNGLPTNGQPGESQGGAVTSDGSTISTPLGEDGYLVMKEPEWRSNYRGDYKGTTVRPICTQDLFCWGFQVARGMEYLASRKVLHGDLAARNILLADDNVVKICDFGFSKSMYKDESYHKKGDGPLPVKWMSIESIRDRVFSTQSDVWAFGIVLWEFFSLARTPYPGMEADEKFFRKLADGYRMEKPRYASNDVYKVMQECWLEKPNLRPSFTKLAERLGDMLENTVRSHYVDMNDPFLKLNAEFLAQEDYLSMLRPPTYSNWQPSNDEGYTSMKPSLTDAKEAMELSPMLDQATGEVNSDTETAPNSPITLQSTSRVTAKTSEQTDQQSSQQTISSDENKPKGNNYVNVHQAIGFANPSYHNLGRPKLNPYMNVPTSTADR